MLLNDTRCPLGEPCDVAITLAPPISAFADGVAAVIPLTCSAPGSLELTGVSFGSPGGTPVSGCGAGGVIGCDAGPCNGTSALEDCVVRARSRGGVRSDKLIVRCRTLDPRGAVDGFDLASEGARLIVGDADGPCFAHGLLPGDCERGDQRVRCKFPKEGSLLRCSR